MQMAFVEGILTDKNNKFDVFQLILSYFFQGGEHNFSNTNDTTLALLHRLSVLIDK